MRTSMAKTRKLKSEAHEAVFGPEKDKFSFSVPLRADIDEEEEEHLEQNMEKVLASEYHVRYLESIGATATKANLDAVRKYVPLTEDAVKLSRKSRGALRDEVTVSSPVLQYQVKLPPVEGKADRPRQMVALGMLSRVLGEEDDDYLQMLPKVESSNPRATHNPHAELAEDELPPTFEEMSSKFLYPFNLRRADKKDAQQRSGSQERGGGGRGAQQAASPSGRGKGRPPPGKHKAPGGARAGGGGTGEGGGGGGGAAEGKRQLQLPGLEDEEEDEEHEEELQMELTQEFRVTDEAVVALLSDFESSVKDWKASMYEESLKDRLAPKDFDRAIACLGQERTVRLFRNVSMFMYEEFLRPLGRAGTGKSRGIWRPSRGETATTGGREEGEEGVRLVNIYEDWATIETRLRKRRVDMFFTLPVMLLALRVSVEALFTTAFPMWASTEGGEGTLAKMEETLTSICDPHGYYSQLSLLQSSPAATAMMSRFARKAHQPAKRHFHDVSPIVRGAIGAPSIGARAIVGSSKDPANPTKGLSEDLRARLFGGAVRKDRRRSKLMANVPVRSNGNMPDRAGWLQNTY